MQSNKVVETSRDPSDPDSQVLFETRLSSFQISNPWGFKFFHNSVNQVDRRQAFISHRSYTALLAGPPFTTDRNKEKCGSFLRQKLDRKEFGPVAQLVRAHA